MKNLISSIALITLSTLIGASHSATAAEVDARLSSREAYVGMPITLQISIADASDYQQPTVPKIDGCDVRSAGSPSQSSQITIINGRRSESRSVTMQYLITPRREGSFEIPALTIQADGKSFDTQPLRFVASKSVSGDLLFVEIAGSKDQVFVGQPLDLTLKIWLKPYRDSQRQLTLSEADMWQMISPQTSWGGFAARIKELAENNQRPGGKEVLRDDGQGNERSYYLYEIEATVYPKRPGKIDADDVQIVVNYPTALGKARSPFAGLFDDSPFGSRDPFGGRSPLSRMMNDDFFASSFGNRLTVSSTRPIVGEVNVDATEVLPVPTEGRPADYRGAVGRYRIVTEATPTTVDAGDPITLNIGIAGTGPMELVQAPPLAELDSLTADFKVADESLAGFVQQGSKVFSTTIRPRREGISEIPPIRFSFFDPDTKSYQTVTSEPIAIKVNKSESLDLETIVGKSRSSAGSQVAASASAPAALPEFTNNHSASVLAAQSPRSATRWWWMFVVIPPAVWIVTWFIRGRNVIVDRLPSFKSASGQCLTAIERAANGPAIAAALTQYIARRSGKACQNTNTAIGALRAAGMYDIANQVESYLQRLQHELPSHEPSQSLPADQQQAVALLEKLDESFKAVQRSRVRSPGGASRKISARDFSKRSLGSLLAVAIALSAGSALAEQPIDLSLTQQQTILDEAGQTYARAVARAATDSADAKALFQTAASKYQLLLDSGIRNSGLYMNLGNAYLQSGELGRAIVNYERARQFDPGNRQLLANLQFANSRVAGQDLPSTSASASWLQSHTQFLHRANDRLVQWIGLRSVIWTLAIASLVFWGLLIARTAGRRFPLWRFAIVPALLLIVSLSSMILTETDRASEFNAVIVASDVNLYAGDGEQFDEVMSVGSSQGHRVKVLGQRGSWSQVRTTSGQIGWLHSKDVERFDV